jgi:lysophospholipase L1-like esterase
MPLLTNQQSRLLGGSVRYLLRDEFTTDRAAGAVNGTAAEPGGTGTAAQKTRAVVDAESKLTLSGGKGVFASGKASPANGDPGLWWGAFTRAAGLAMAVDFNIGTAGYWQAGWDTGQTGSIQDSVYLLNTATVACMSNNVSVSLTGGNNPYTVATDYVASVILRSLGAQFFMRGGAYGSWRRLWVSKTGNGATVYPGINNYSTVNTTVDNLTVNALAAPFDTDYGGATAYTAGAVSEADAFAHDADAYIYLDNVTLPSAGSIRVAFRRDDDDNCWILDINSAGNLSLILRTGGVDGAALSTSAGAVTAAARVAIGWDGSNLRSWVGDAQKTNSDNAKQLQGRTAGKVLSLGTGGAITGMHTWACYPGGTQRAVLNGFRPRAGTYGVFFGDSVTAGTGASDAAHRYANIVAAAQGWTLVNSGIAGTALQNSVQSAAATIGLATDNNGRDTCANRVVRHAPDKVVILYGLNDLRLDDAGYSTANYQTDLGEVVDLIVAGGTPAGSIVIGSPSYCTNYAAHAAPWNGGSAEKHAAYVAAAAAVATAKGTRYADVYAAMVAGGGNTLLSADNVHPNDAGHAVIATAIQAAL